MKNNCISNYITRLGNYAVHKAQKMNTQKGIPNVYSIKGKIFYQLPNGKITDKSPFKKKLLQKIKNFINGFFKIKL